MLISSVNTFCRFHGYELDNSSMEQAMQPIRAGMPPMRWEEGAAGQPHPTGKQRKEEVYV